jgi:type IV pilus assembly protein PilX
MKPVRFESGRRQRGAVMVISLLLLLIMTVLALSASQTTRMQERMAGNSRDHDLALQSAEAGVRGAERWIKDLAAAPSPCASGKCNVYELDVPANDKSQTKPLIYRNQTWWDGVAQSYTASSDIKGSSSEPGMAKANPQFMIEEQEDVPDALSVPPTGPPPSRLYYKITARGVGGSDQSAVVIQSTWSRRF